jgi:hypothetical protein
LPRPYGPGPLRVNVEFNWIVDDTVESVWTAWCVAVDKAATQLWMEVVGKPSQGGDLRQHSTRGVHSNNFWPPIGLRSAL